MKYLAPSQQAYTAGADNGVIVTENGRGAEE